MTADSCDCPVFEYGDYVRSIQNPHLTGQIIGERNWGEEYNVRLADGASTIWWHSVEFEHDLEMYEPPQVAAEGDNVIQVDFTKRRTMTPENNTEGAA